MEEYKEPQVKEGTVITYNNYYNFYIKGGLGKKKMVNIRGEHIQKLYNKMNKDGMKVSSITIISAVLNGCFKQAVKNGIIERNPVSLASLPKSEEDEEAEERRVFTVMEQNLFVKYAKTSYLYNMFALTLCTGTRNGEIRGLKPGDINKELGVIHIKRTLKYESGRGFFEAPPKTKTSKRDIPLTQHMIELIEAQRNVISAEKVVKINPYIFRLPDGTPISRERYQSEIDRIIKRINDDGIEFERFTPHCFRHTFATRVIENGMKPQTLKTIMGHAKLSMTMDLYSHVLPSTKSEEMELISKVF